MHVESVFKDYELNYYIILQKDERFNGRMGFGGTSPCAQTKGEKVFLDRHPEDMLKDGDFAPKDIVFGANKAEGSFVLGGMIHYFFL